MKAPLPVGLALVLAAGLLSGCGANNPLGPAEQDNASTESAQVSASLAEAPEMVEDGLFESEEVYALDALVQEGALGTEEIGAPALGALAPIRPLRYWRHINSIRRAFEFEFSDPDPTGQPTVAIVTMKKLLRGSFNILALDPTAPDAEPSLVQKRMADLWTRRFVLKRAPRRAADEPTIEAHRHLRWKLVGTSGVEIQSLQPDVSDDVARIDVAGEPTTKIRAIEIRSRDFEAVITDPLELQRLRAIMQFSPGEEVKITVHTLAADDVVALMHRDHKFKFEANGDNSYSGVWRVPAHRGIHHVGFNALSNGTLFDDEASYSSSGWILNYVVAGMGPELAWIDD